MALPGKSSGSSFGALNKVNYQKLPPSDQLVDWDNTLIGPAFCDVAALSQTSPLAIVRITLATTTGGLVLNSWEAVWKNITTTAPVVARTSAGIFTITWPTVVSDEYSASFGIYNTHPVNFKYGFANMENPTQGATIHVSPSANVWTVKIFQSSTDSLSDFNGFYLNVFGF